MDQNVPFFDEDPKEIFVFGSNLAGRHGKGAALHAHKYYKAKYGVGKGRTGDSYAIPTKDKHLDTLSLYQIRGHVRRFLNYALFHEGLTFTVTRVGCGLAGYKDEDIAPMFRKAPPNCKLPPEWVKILQPKVKTCIDTERHSKLLPRTRHSVCRQSSSKGMRFGFEVMSGMNGRYRLFQTSTFQLLADYLTTLQLDKDYIVRFNYKMARFWFKDQDMFWTAIQQIGRNTRYNDVHKSWAPLFEENIAEEFSDNIVTVRKEIYKPRIPNKYVVKAKKPKRYSRDFVKKLHDYCAVTGITECAALIKAAEIIEHPRSKVSKQRSAGLSWTGGSADFYLDLWFGVDNLGVISFLLFYDKDIATRVYANTAYKREQLDSETKD